MLKTYLSIESSVVDETMKITLRSKPVFLKYEAVTKGMAIAALISSQANSWVSEWEKAYGVLLSSGDRTEKVNNYINNQYARMTRPESSPDILYFELARITGKSESARNLLYYDLNEMQREYEIKDKFNKLIANLPQSRNLAANNAAGWLNFELRRFKSEGN